MLNDMWCANYSTTHHQALIIDIFNSWLPTLASGPMDLLSPRAAVAKHYAGLASTTDIYLAYPRRLVLTELKHAVENLRTMTTQDAMWIGTQYCWVDLTQRFEVAHTQNRQDRCENLHKANGAVYMETVLRNIAWSDLRGYYGQSDGIFGMVVLDWLLQ
ncbi:hypothetical protein DYB36_013367, partial [Aphanomyces astaci]